MIGQPNQPAVLIATLGTEPQVVTAALDLLERQGEKITKTIVLHTTDHGTPIAESVERLRLAFRQPPYHGNIGLELNPLKDGSGDLLADVETPDAARAAFHTLYNMVRRAKKDGYRVHLSIAGGRKTMAVFGMVSAQMLFDEGDRLWHLYSAGEFLESKRLHPSPDDDVHLIEIPVVEWSSVAPILLDLAETNDPFEALERQRGLRLAERLEEGRAFVLGSLTPAEREVVSLLVTEGLSDRQIAERLVVSPRTVEEHLRSAYRKAEDHWEVSGVTRTQLIALLNLYYSTQVTGNPA